MKHEQCWAEAGKTKHFSAQLDIRMYIFVYEIIAQRAERREEVFSLYARRYAFTWSIHNKCLAFKWHEVSEDLDFQ